MKPLLNETGVNVAKRNDTVNADTNSLSRANDEATGHPLAKRIRQGTDFPCTMEDGDEIADALDGLLAAARAAIAYDSAINACANDPEKMASFCTAEGDDLDALYLEWIGLARAAMASTEGTAKTRRKQRPPK